MNAKLPLKKKLWILREYEIYREMKPKKIAARHDINQATVYKLWRNRAEIRSRVK